MNGENLLLIRDRRVAVSYVVEALRIFDHYHFRVTQLEAKKAKKKLPLAKPPRKPGETRRGGPRTMQMRGRFAIASSSRRELDCLKIGALRAPFTRPTGQGDEIG